MRLSLVFLLLLLSSVVTTHKILVYIPKFAISHIHFMGKIADVLVEAGHDVTALVSEMDGSMPDGTKKAKIIRISPAQGANEMNTHFMVGDTDMFEVSMGYTSTVQNAYHNAMSFSRQCDKLFSTPGLIESLKNEKFDALITEAFDNCAVGISHIIKPNALISVSTTLLYDTTIFGLSNSMISDYSVMSDPQLHNTLYSRLRHFYLQFLGLTFYHVLNDELQAVFDRHFPGTPEFWDIVADSAVVFSNSDPLTDVGRPTLSKIVPIGGLTVGEPKQLDEYWSGILSLREKTVLVSFGSLAKSVLMKQSRKASLLKAFASLPDTTFIWKYEDKNDSFAKNEAAKVPNVILTEWMPQLDILADPRLSLFVSHAGMASCHEITTFGVPSLLIPIFGDQTHNAGALAHNGLARVFDKFDMMNADKLALAIREMLTNEKYRIAARRISEQLGARPTSPRERLVKNVEFAARFGPSKSLRPVVLDLNTLQYYGIDLMLVALCLLSVVIALSMIVYRLIESIVRIFRVKDALKKE